jgi:hypothetical protein
MSCENSRLAAIERAYELGLSVVYGDETTLQLDIDCQGHFDHARKMLGSLKKLINYSVVTYTRSKSGFWHIYVNLKAAMDYKERILWQSCLGSDRMREALNFTYTRDGGKGASCLKRPTLSIPF